jgi:hypothetical protein
VINAIDHARFDHELVDTGMKFFDRNRVTSIVLDLETELCRLDAKSSILRDQDRAIAAVSEIETAREQSMIGSGWIEHGGETSRNNPVELDPETPATREANRLLHPLVTGCSEHLEK